MRNCGYVGDFLAQIKPHLMVMISQFSFNSLIGTSFKALI